MNGGGWTWETQTRGAHAGAYDIDECGDALCVECQIVRSAGKHRR
ncbi:MAG TPA: hypothetical protein VN375_19240 [Vicinamibacteria bacterium]|jgi:hypothetical protein|nr:hypothetical protein [Vicinamibacteria bacterium]